MFWQRRTQRVLELESGDSGRRGFFQTQRRQTDLNQAEDIPPLGSSPRPDPQFYRTNSAGKERENHESIVSA
jgi:hypothetical protein